MKMNGEKYFNEEKNNSMWKEIIHRGNHNNHWKMIMNFINRKIEIKNKFKC